MKVVLSVLFFISNVSAQTNTSSDEWFYDEQEKWNSLFRACSGNHESPINIDTSKVVMDSTLTIDFYNYDKYFVNSTAQNNGHTVRIFLTSHDPSQTPYISGGVVHKEKFILDSFHFHWGDNDLNGSEHSINNIRKSGELHFVHWNQIYGNMSNARDRVDGLAVVTVFLESEYLFNLTPLIPITRAVDRIKKFGTDTKIREPLNLYSLLPSDRNLFYRYEGSLTTPPCSESATFIIFTKPIHISSYQLSRFREIRAEPENGVSKPLKHNLRQQQPLNDRIVQVSNPLSNSIFGRIISSVFG